MHNLATFVWMPVSTHIHSFMCTHACTYIHVCLIMPIHTNLVQIYLTRHCARGHTHTHTCSFFFSSRSHIHIEFLCIHTHVRYMHECTRVHVWWTHTFHHTCTCIHTCTIGVFMMYKHTMYMHTYNVNMYTRMYVLKHTHAHAQVVQSPILWRMLMMFR